MNESQEEQEVVCVWEEEIIHEEEPDDSPRKKMYPDLQECQTRPLHPFSYQRGQYWVLENYIPADRSYPCNQSITYTTHGDYTFLDNLEPLTSRWQGPVSVAVYAPGQDFQSTIDSIIFLRKCGSENVKNYVTFHIYFPISHIPSQVPTAEEVRARKGDCEQGLNLTKATTYRHQNGLLYPVNVGRNVARLAAQTYFVLPSDIELYPSVNFIPEFFKMLKRKDASRTTKPRIYVLSIFEVKAEESPPETKRELLKMLKSKKAIPFHKYLCKICHTVPQAKKWRRTRDEPNLSVFYIAQRHAPYGKWEPIYVGTNAEPLYDERLSWEGESDKMTQ
ncbi:beta-1,4-glucuronyltransferase 1-like, partial [Homarus americanus]|uniref:beta-1,4-glucuronyltransferase 1-like n=1 Tax=Homarus americanus TaxID=6706 RepID=UPI001C447688